MKMKTAVTTLVPIGVGIVVERWLQQSCCRFWTPRQGKELSIIWW